MLGNGELILGTTRKGRFLLPIELYMQPLTSNMILFRILQIHLDLSAIIFNRRVVQSSSQQMGFIRKISSQNNISMHDITHIIAHRPQNTVSGLFVIRA